MLSAASTAVTAGPPAPLLLPPAVAARAGRPWRVDQDAGGCGRAHVERLPCHAPRDRRRRRRRDAGARRRHTADPGVVPAVRSVVACPLPFVGPLVGARLATTPGAAVTVQVTVALTSGAACRSCTVAVNRSVPPVGTLGVAALTLTLPAMPASIRKWIGRARPSFATMRSPEIGRASCREREYNEGGWSCIRAQ